MARRGLLYIVSSPSGAGKTTLARRLLAADRNIAMSVSVTTRPARPANATALTITSSIATRFEIMKERGDLLNGRASSTITTARRAPLSRRQSSPERTCSSTSTGKVRSSCRRKCRVTSSACSCCRLRGPCWRNGSGCAHKNSPETVARRMAAASSEISHWPEYDYVIVNSDLETSVNSALAILTAERLKRARLLGLSAFVRDMQAVL